MVSSSFITDILHGYVKKKKSCINLSQSNILIILDQKYTILIDCFVIGYPCLENPFQMSNIKWCSQMAAIQTPTTLFLSLPLLNCPSPFSVQCSVETGKCKLCFWIFNLKIHLMHIWKFKLHVLLANSHCFWLDVIYGMSVII